MNDPILIYTENISNRLKYVSDWIFKEQLKCNYLHTTNWQQWLTYEGVKINYSSQKNEDTINILPEGLISEKDIKHKNINIHRWKHSTIIFYNNPGARIPFDIFSAVFYLISRYEEYLIVKRDKHDRFNASESIAGKYFFLQQPVIDEWIHHLETILEEKYVKKLSEKKYQFQLTYDIDMVWAYLNKSKINNLAGLGKDMLSLKWSNVKLRAQVLGGKKADPFDNFEYMDQVHQQFDLKPIYFLLVSTGGPYDNNTSPTNPQMIQWVQRQSLIHELGIHPSYDSHKHRDILIQEINTLEELSGQKLTKSRQHYIKFTLPGTYRQLIEVGILHDYSMGYATVNGFRAGTSCSFLWYDLIKDEVTQLRIHPFAFMDATSVFYLSHKPEDAIAEWERLCIAVKNTNGTLTGIWHNYLLGNFPQYEGWKEAYLKMLKIACS